MDGVVSRFTLLTGCRRTLFLVEIPMKYCTSANVIIISFVFSGGHRLRTPSYYLFFLLLGNKDDRGI